MNFGIFSARCFRFRSNRPVPKFPNSSECDWLERLDELGQPFSGTKNRWWRIRADAHLAHLDDVFRRVEKDGLPAMERFGSEEKLRTYWRSRSPPSYASLLAVTVQDGSSENDIARLIEEYRQVTRGTPSEPVAERVIAKVLSMSHRKVATLTNTW